jgi:nucleotide-binding universal stress UspA family protein
MNSLLATAGSNSSSAAAQNIAKLFRPLNNEVRILTVVGRVSTAILPQMSPGYYPELEQQRGEAKAFVESTAKMLATEGFEVSTSVLTGDAKTVILDEAAGWPADLIVVGSHGHKGLGRFLLGSVSAAVARHAACSVEIVRTTPR